jgi:peptidoglycan hydrolase-like protein with peptidoglycan-binding domain
MTMIRKLILGTASILVLGIASPSLDFAAHADDVANAAPGSSEHWLDATNLSKDDIRWAQVELHTIGLYNGSLDGIIGPETTRALLEFQKSNGLERTARLDQHTADVLIGGPGVGQGSGMPPKGAGTGSMTNSSGASDFGSRTRQN